MRKAGKYLMVFFIAIFIMFAYTRRYNSVNQELRSPDVESYNLGEEVEMGKDILINYTMEGYSVAVNQAEVLTYEEFLNKYQAEDEYTYVPEKVYDVEITLKNINAADDTGINLSEYYVQGLAVCAGLDTNLCSAANPNLNGSYAIALRKDSEMVLHLPFALYQNNFRADTWNHMEDFDMSLVATLYPTKKIISLQ